jgi:hypothetical protein
MCICVRKASSVKSEPIYTHVASCHHLSEGHSTLFVVYRAKIYSSTKIWHKKKDYMVPPWLVGRAAQQDRFKKKVAHLLTVDMAYDKHRVVKLLGNPTTFCFQYWIVRADCVTWQPASRECFSLRIYRVETGLYVGVTAGQHSLLPAFGIFQDAQPVSGPVIMHSLLPALVSSCVKMPHPPVWEADTNTYHFKVLS